MSFKNLVVTYLFIWGTGVPLFSLYSYGQTNNLVLNPSFEECNLFKTTLSVYTNGKHQIIDVNDTFLFPGAANRKYVNVISKYWNYSTYHNHIQANANYSNTKFARNGYFFDTFSPLDYGYITDNISAGVVVGKLCKPLEAGQKYNISIALKPFSGNYYTKSIGVIITKDTLPLLLEISKNAFKPLNFDSLSVAWRLNDILTDTSEYTQFNFLYQASGGEIFLVITNPDLLVTNYFRKKIFKSYFKKATKQYGYFKNHNERFQISYAVDDVYVYPLDTTEHCLVNHLPNKIDALSDTILIGEFYFNHNQTNPLTEFSNILSESYLSQFKHFISKGYTDSTGENEYNIKLSQKRAEVIAEMIHSLTGKNVFISGEGILVEALSDNKARCVKVFGVK